MKPSCFGQYPSKHPHITAERCCDDCPNQLSCMAKTGTKEMRELGAEIMKEAEELP